MRSIYGQIVGAAISAAMLVAPSFAQQRGVSDDEILLGSIQALSGPVASWGVPITNGLNMAVNDINAAGGINGRTLRLIVEDDQYDPRKTLEVADKLIKHDNVFAFVSNLGTPHSLALMKLVKEDEVPLVFPQSAEPKLWTPPSKLVFGLIFPNPQQGILAVRYLVETRKYTKLGVIYQDDDLGKSFLTGIEEELGRRGMSLAEKAGIARGQIDASSQVAKMKAAGVEAIFLATVIPPAVSVLKEREKLGWNVDVVVPSSAVSDAVIKLGGDAAEGVLGISQMPVPYADHSAALADWAGRYEKAYNSPADMGAAVGYQAMMLFKEGAVNAGRDLTVDSLAAGLEKMKDYTDLFEAVPYTITPDLHLASRGVYIFKVKDKRWVKDSDYIPLER